MRARIFHRLISVAAGAFLAAAMGVASGTTVALVSHPHAAHAASSVGGTITRSEVLSRAQWWINTYGVIYSQNQANAKLDPEGAHRYRPDCSGFVSMAWHLPKKSDGWDRNTGDLAGFGDTTWLGSLGDLQPGDAILGVGYGHVALFDRWTDSSKTRMWIYDEFSSSAQGRHDIKDRSWYQANGFRGLRYNKIVNDGGGGGPVKASPVSVADFNGDGKADIGAQYVGGEIREWAGTGDLSADMRLFTGDGTVVGAGWTPSNVERIVTADFTGDGKADIAAQYTSGLMRVWASTGNMSVDMGLFTGAGTLVGEGWNASNVERIVVGDFNGDRKADIAAQYTNGQMRAWASTGDLSADMRLFTGAGTLVGAGWNSGSVQRIVTGDFNGDKKTDIAAQYTTGEMRAWASTGDLSADMRLFTGAGIVIGAGWNSGNVERIVVGDFNGDKKTDIAAQYTNGQMRAWASTGDLSADLRLFTGAGTLIGAGWNSGNVQRII